MKVDIFIYAPRCICSLENAMQTTKAVKSVQPLFSLHVTNNVQHSYKGTDVHTHPEKRLHNSSVI